MNRQNGARLSVSISETNRQKLDRLATEQNVVRGAIVDEALTLLFLPPAERPEAILTAVTLRDLVRSTNAADRGSPAQRQGANRDCRFVR